jgi:hypothetical protein
MERRPWWGRLLGWLLRKLGVRMAQDWQDDER